MAETFEPVTLSDVKAAIGKLLPLDKLDIVSPKLTDRPARNTWAVVGLTSFIFYLAERGHNPKVNSILDASIYCSTCLSVGYGDIFAKTPVGKMVGTFLMTIGPALSNATLDGPRDAKREQLEQEILAKLTEILKELQKQSEAGGQELPNAGQVG